MSWRCMRNSFRRWPQCRAHSCTSSWNHGCEYPRASSSTKSPTSVKVRSKVRSRGLSRAFLGGACPSTAHCGRALAAFSSMRLQSTSLGCVGSSGRASTCTPPGAGSSGAAGASAPLESPRTLVLTARLVAAASLASLSPSPHSCMILSCSASISLHRSPTGPGGAGPRCLQEETSMSPAPRTAAASGGGRLQSGQKSSR
mmetsp:Transcript_4499/g.12384  ORF Transcript_4499/g.12384 Transcript_4499/m.12384 type:complete len:200 (+) Transcript_4499:148-747(+)